MTFDQFVAPIGDTRFMAEYHGRRPVHLPAATGTARLAFSWTQLNALFNSAAHWTDGHLKLLLNSQPIAPEHYLDEVQTMDGVMRRADPAKVNLFLGMGASLVANAVDQVSPDLAAACTTLARQFTALVGANVYCSFDGIQAFATHYDTHDVFALQCEGEKTWRIYANRAAEPVDPPVDGPEAQARIDAARGRLVMEVTTRPGDLLYIPRGFYHDALAQRGASLHVSFAVAPRTGLAIRPLLEAAMRRDAAFRAYLPLADEENGAALADRLAELGDRLAEMMRSPGFAIEVANEQRKAAQSRAAVALPARSPSSYFARTDRAAELRRSPAGVTLHVNGRAVPTGAAYEAAEWALARQAFSVAELEARFGYVPANDRQALLATLQREGLVEPYSPAIN